MKRRCSVCGETKPETLEFFPRKPGKGSVYLKRICRVCFAAKKKISDARSYALHRETRRNKENARYEERVADPVARQKERDRLHGLYLANKEEFIKRAAEWRKANKDYANKLARDRHDPEKARQEYERNRDKIRFWQLKKKNVMPI